MRIYVGNLPFGTTEPQLRSLFETFGAVEEAKIITDRETGRSRGFGFVAMDSDRAGEAIRTLHQADYEGRRLVVNEAKPRQGGAPTQSYNGGKRAYGWDRD